MICAGVLDMTANVLYLLAVQGGPLSIVAPVASLYPVTTVLLATLIDRERMRPTQLAGLGLAVTALVMAASSVPASRAGNRGRRRATVRSRR